jgi:hypothetical protein
MIGTTTRSHSSGPSSQVPERRVQTVLDLPDELQRRATDDNFDVGRGRPSKLGRLGGSSDPLGRRRRGQDVELPEQSLHIIGSVVRSRRYYDHAAVAT